MTPNDLNALSEIVKRNNCVIELFKDKIIIWGTSYNQINDIGNKLRENRNPYFGEQRDEKV